MRQIVAFPHNLEDTEFYGYFLPIYQAYVPLLLLSIC
jgi:hypothetical protein